MHTGPPVQDILTADGGYEESQASPQPSQMIDNPVKVAEV